ncbi:MAG: adenine nucleotide alpha hydrolase [Thermoplasmata archaeon]|nr:adenine nucleotide alpha hydrolase [Thermoplasmata archaeon]MCI4358885.1 adenine nucleotide alpha hydrolase [Thermoplasmata archaeon]
MVSWSSGKDAAFALHELRRSRDRPVVGLLTTVTRKYDRVSMHGVRRSVLDLQARAVGLPVRTVEIPSPCPNSEYERAMQTEVREMVRDRVTGIAFGDLYLADIRAYREMKLSGSGLEALFPLWARPTDALAREILRAGFDARIVCVDPRRLGAEFAGRHFDEEFLRDLPEGVDPCGENGEFHTCVVDGPIFDRPIPVRAGPVVERDGFVFADLIPTGEGGAEGRVPTKAAP